MIEALSSPWKLGLAPSLWLPTMLKLSVDGADVELKKVVLQWDNRKDDTLTNLGVLKAGGSTTPQDAPGRKGRLTAVTVEYTILGNAPTAVVKVWGYD